MKPVDPLRKEGEQGQKTSLLEVDVRKETSQFTCALQARQDGASMPLR